MKTLLLFVLMLFTTSILAESLRPTDIELEAFSKANNKFNRSLIALNRIEESCKKSAVTLPGEIFQGLDISEEDKKKVLIYHHLKANADCAEEALKNYLVSSAELAYLLYPFEPDRVRMLNEGNELIMDIRIRLLKAEVEYGRLDEDLRGALDQIEALRKPFKLIESAEAVGLK